MSRRIKPGRREIKLDPKHRDKLITQFIASLMKRGTTDVAEKIRAAIESMRFQVPETDIGIKVTVSIGVSVFRGNRREFFNAADRALYQSKAEGKNRVRYAPEA